MFKGSIPAVITPFDGDKVGDSPVVPHGTKPFDPLLIENSIIFSKELKSTLLFSKGVINAGILP